MVKKKKTTLRQREREREREMGETEKKDRHRRTHRVCLTLSERGWEWRETTDRQAGTEVERVCVYDPEKELVGALSPVNHKGLYQG